VKIIGHRGSRGTETENTIEALKAGAASGADRVEFDVWTSKDGIPILLHDADFKRMTGHNQRVFDMTYAQIKKLETTDGKKIPTADQALKAIGKTPAYMEIKDYYLSGGVLKVLDKYKSKDIWVGSNNHKVIAELQKKRPHIKTFAGTLWHPIETMHFIRKNEIKGMSLHFRWFNPIIYLFCRRYDIELLLYTLNSSWHIKLIKKIYPRVSIFTDYPERTVKLLRSLE
jgi:glycerophosphoryl diester phosphodiesterase